MCVEKNQVDITGQVKLISSQLTHPENDQLFRYTIWRQRLAITPNRSLVTIVEGCLYTKIRQTR